MAEFDVLIVGGGIAGASLGARLAPRLDTLLIETEDLCGRHATARSAAFWQATLGPRREERLLSLASRPMFDDRWPGSEVDLLRPRGTLHLTTAEREPVPGAVDMPDEYVPTWFDRPALDRLVPGLREQWVGAWHEPSCADIDVAAFHGACLAAIRRAGGTIRTDARLERAEWTGDGWRVEAGGETIRARTLVNAAGAWGDEVARLSGVAPLGLEPRRRTVVQVRVAREGLRDLPLTTDLHRSFYFKGEADRSVWVCPLDETPVEPCDAAPEDIDVATAIDRLQRAVDWPVEAVERKWAGLRTFGADRRMRFGFDPDCRGFFWCVGQGGMGIQTAPAASLLCASLILDVPLPQALAGIDPAAFEPR